MYENAVGCPVGPRGFWHAFLWGRDSEGSGHVEVKPNSIWFQDAAKLAHWQTLKKNAMPLPFPLIRTKRFRIGRRGSFLINLPSRPSAVIRQKTRSTSKGRPRVAGRLQRAFQHRYPPFEPTGIPRSPDRAVGAPFLGGSAAPFNARGRTSDIRIKRVRRDRPRPAPDSRSKDKV